MTNIKIGQIGIAATIGALALLANALNKGQSPMDTAMAVVVILIALVCAVWALANITQRKGQPKTTRRSNKDE